MKITNLKRFLVIIFTSLALYPLVLSEPITLKQGSFYSTNQSIPEIVNTSSLLESAKQQGFWIRVGTGSNATYYNGTEYCSNCAQENEEKFLKGNRIYIEPAKNTFSLVLEKPSYISSLGTSSPNKKLLTIRITPTQDVKTSLVKSEVAKTLLDLEVFKNKSKINFTFPGGVKLETKTNTTILTTTPSKPRKIASNSTFYLSVLVLALILIGLYWWNKKK